MAEKNSRNSEGDQKKFYDRKVRGAVLAPGDRVLVRKVGLKGMQKLADHWSEEVYTVIDQLNSDILVYRVKLEDGRSAVKTLHRNLLLLLCALPIVRKPVPRASRTITPVKPITPDSSVSDGSDDNEASSSDESILVMRRSQSRRFSAVTVSVDGQVDVLNSDSVLNETVSRSVTKEDVELQVPSVDTDEASLDITQNNSSHEMRVTSESGDLSVRGSSDLAGIACNSSNQSDTSAANTGISSVSNGSVEPNETISNTEISSVSDTVLVRTPPNPAPRSGRGRNQGHLRSDFVYNFSQVPQEHEPESKLELEKISLLKNMIAILK